MGRKLGLLVRMFITLVVVMSLGVVFAQPIVAQPPSLPHAFYGALTIDDEPAPAGAMVEARGEGVTTGIQGNPIITSEEGWYGSDDPMGPKLVVQGNIEKGTTLTFYVNGESTGQTFVWLSGEVTRLDLTATSPAQPVVVNVVNEGATPSAPPASQEGPAETVAEPAETIAEPPEAAVTSTTLTEEAGSTTNWPVIGGIIAAVVVVALLVFFFVVRRRRAPIN